MSFTVSDPMACKRACSRQTSCHFFLMDTPAGVCMLASMDLGPVTQPAMQSSSFDDVGIDIGTSISKCFRLFKLKSACYSPGKLKSQSIEGNQFLPVDDVPFNRLQRRVFNNFTFGQEHEQYAEELCNIWCKISKYPSFCSFYIMEGTRTCLLGYVSDFNSDPFSNRRVKAMLNLGRL